MKKYIYILMLPAVLFVFCGCSDVSEQKTKLPTRVETQVVSIGTTDYAQTYVGVVEEQEGTAVSFTNMGIIKRMLVREGQTVTKGQPIAEMDDTQARNLLQGAEAQMAQANDAFKRYKMLHDNGSLPEVQWVEIQSKVAQAQSQLEVARKNLEDCRLIAPVSGIIGKKLVGAGETALPSQVIVNILDISTVKVKVAVPESEISHITSDTPTSIYVEATKENYQGGHIEKGVQADVLTHTYDIRINVSNNERKLLPGMVASVSFASSLASNKEQMMLPITSVQKKAEGSLFVWTIDENKIVHRTIVSIGHIQGNHVSVTGLDSGQRIVTEGYQKLSEGTKVIY